MSLVKNIFGYSVRTDDEKPFDRFLVQLGFQLAPHNLPKIDPGAFQNQSERAFTT